MFVLLLLTWTTSAQAAQNSKRPAAASPTALITKPLARAAAALGQVATMTAAMDREMVVAARKVAKASGNALGNGLARLTAYWCGEGDYNTRHHISATGVRLHAGHCAVDPSVIPYGSVVQIDGLGTFLAVDTGTAVVSRKAARKGGHSKVERHALVVDLFFENRRQGEQFASSGPKYAAITWWTPQSLASEVPGSIGSSLVTDSGSGHGSF